MRISSGRKTLMLVGILVISGAAFVYFDPLGLDLLGLQQHAVVTKPAPAPHPAVPAVHPLQPAAHPPIPAPQPAVVPAHVAASSVLPSGAGAPQAMNAAHPPVIVQHAAVPAATASTVVPVAPAAAPAAAPAEVAQLPAQPAKPARAAKKPAPVKPMIPKDADLRHCLDLESDAAIAKCAGE